MMQVQQTGACAPVKLMTLRSYCTASVRICALHIFSSCSYLEETNIEPMEPMSFQKATLERALMPFLTSLCRSQTHSKRASPVMS